MLKIVLLVALVPLAMGGPMMNQPQMQNMMMQFMRMMAGGDRGGNGGNQGGDMGNHGGNGGGYGNGGGNGGDQHHSGDGDCHSQDEAMRKNYELMKQMQEMKKKMEEKKEMEKAWEKMQEFYEYKEKMEEEEKKREMEEKHREWMEKQKEEEEMKKMEKENEFKHLIESFTEKKAHFAFSLTHHFLTMCKCGEIDYQMSQMFDGEHMGNNSGVMDGMGDHDIMDLWAQGNYEEVARMMKMMSKEEQKKMYMSNLIKAMCSGARHFINMSKQFELTYMTGEDAAPADNNNQGGAGTGGAGGAGGAGAGGAGAGAGTP